MDFLSQLVKMIQGGDTYISQRPENLGVRYKKYGPLSIIDGAATPDSKKAALANRKAGNAPEMTPASQAQVSSAPHDPRPFKMYEDYSFQGNPQQFQQANPGYRFYEDNTFSTPQQHLVRTNMRYGDVLIPDDRNSNAGLLRQLQMRPRPNYKRYEDGSMILGNTSRPAFDSLDDFTGINRY